MAPAQLSIREHDLRIRAVGRPASAESVRVAVAERLAEVAPLAGSGYWVIRSLELRAVVRTEWTAVMIADSIARQLSDRMAAQVHRGMDPAAALWFPDRAAFLCAFLVDLAGGRANARWEYGQFAPLLGDPASALARLAADESNEVLGALLRLTDRELDAVVDTIGAEWIDAIIADLSIGTGDSSPRNVIDVVADRARAARTRPGARGGLFVAIIVARRSGARLATVASAAMAAAAVADAVDRAGGRRARLLSAIAAGDWSLVRILVTADEFDRMLGLVSWSTDDRERLAAALSPSAPPAADGGDKTVFTPFGGMFLLLPLIDDMWDWQAATRSWPVGPRISAAAALRLRVIAAALVGGRPARVVHDGLLRRALAIGQDVSDDEMAEIVRGLTADQLSGFVAVAGSALPERADAATGVDASDPVDALVGCVATALMHALGSRLPGQAAASIDHLRREVLDIDAYVRWEGTRAVVELSHPPLGVVVSLSGLNRGDFRMPEGEELTWTLTTSG